MATKLHALRVLIRMIRWLSNWREVWNCYRGGRAVAPLRFRAGFTLHHGLGDDPIMLLHEVFAEGSYRRYLGDEGEGVMIDLGANIGAVTLDMASRASALRVYAYEPNPRTNETLRRNIEGNGLGSRVTVHSDAVGRTAGESRLWTNLPSLLSTGCAELPPSPEAVAVSVPMVDLNEVIGRAGGERVALLKIDTEGAEADILEGAAASTLRAIDRVVLEYHDQLCPDALSRCRRVLESAGFCCRVRPANPYQGLLHAWRDRL